MKAEAALSGRLEPVLGKLLHYGTLVATAVTAAGLALVVASGVVASAATGMRVATGGIVFFILLPVLRVGAMLIFFLRVRDYRFGAIAALVLLIILFSFEVGAR